MNWTLRRVNAPEKKWSMNEKWFGARMTGPLGGTLSESMHCARKKVKAYIAVHIFTAS